MIDATWRERLGPAPADPALRSWLRENTSLTARCQRASRHFRVRLLAYGSGRPLADDVSRPWQRVREVALECDGQPVIFAHTTLPRAGGGRLTRWMARLGERSLGSLLFAHPAFRRGPIECRRLRPQEPLYRRAAALLAAAPGELWARRSRHWLDGQGVLVCEVFLPAIATLEKKPRHNLDD